MNSFLSYTLLGNAIGAYFISLGVFALSIFVLLFFKKIVIEKLQEIAQKTRSEADDLIINFIAEISWPFYFILSLWIAFYFISLNNAIRRYFNYFVLLVVIFYLAEALHKLVDFGTEKFIAREEEKKKEVNKSIIQLFGKLLKITIWSVAILFLLQNFGFNISALVAGLGIGGIAIAFAIQNILTDIFSCFSIYFDKPFEIGDFIVVDNDAGFVEKIGIKSTRIRTLQGEELVISNRELTEKRVHNYKKMEKRRIVFNFGVTYDTSLEKLKEILNIVEAIIKEIKITNLDRVHFKSFGDFSLIFEVVYYLDSNDYKVYMDTQQEINFKIKEELDKRGISMAFPTQTIILEKGL